MKKILAYIFISVFMVNMVVPLSQPVVAQSIDELKQELEALEEERQNINSNASDAEEQIEENEARQQEVKAKIAELDEDLAVTADQLETKQNEINVTENDITTIQSNIATTENEITETEAEIVLLNEEIEDLMERIDERQELISSRLRSMQRTGGNASYLELVFSAQSFSDFISRLTAVSKILDSDKNIMEIQKQDKLDLEEKRVEVETKKADLETKRAELTAAKEELESKKANLVAQKQDLARIQEQLNIQRANQSDLMVQLEEEHAELEEYKVTLADQQEIKRKEAAALQQAIKNAEAEANKSEEQLGQESGDSASAGSGSSGGVLFWPASTRRVTSSFNPNRVHPITGVVRPHRGMDIASPGTQQIYAAADGVVVATYTQYDGRMNGYGDAILLTHYMDLNGDGTKEQVSTLYAHLRSGSTRVSSGQSVSRGDTIALMGNTGVGTGQHLHFEVHFGGWAHANAVNPATYLY
ncbi:N-terminal domain of peptidoglycan hydrolase CwlO-containing protein [Halolactibacillus halophilus]|uniref:N-terminal domain of peptidoglycan hydrolase CwlO-containing protein n=1 Tax=Halolactibacillus halophilus TaxID=306540 RepID=A0A1I5PI09_9BACI|nr:peptidoglycan DD-metalloendopeptidase family protein [Halolactibacillus halophilus]GEM02029.1 peptidase [Halolactibacillus halophilus]SFP33762.1 N-terminal domain of peptidoglycan hydrolase CwlO-containing protein [Halolactibacillus halophilus]